jgi:nucleotide-binding universal stress UspA family protein
MAGPVLFCYDGSAGSRGALRSAGDLIARPSDGYVLSVWQPAYVRMAMAGAFAPAGLSNEDEIDEQEESYARQAAEEGARLGHEHGFDLTALVERADEGISHTILDVAGRLDASLIVCGQRGRGPVRSALLGSVSHALASRAARPVLIAPDLG